MNYKAHLNLVTLKVLQYHPLFTDEVNQDREYLEQPAYPLSILIQSGRFFKRNINKQVYKM